jgi:hypothetical protein
LIGSSNATCGRRSVERWSSSFNKLEALASLYSKNAFFFGSNPTLYRGNKGARYFNALPRHHVSSMTPLIQRP